MRSPHIIAEEKFAIAPPTGVSPCSDNNDAEEFVAYSGHEVKATPGSGNSKTLGNRLQALVLWSFGGGAGFVANTLTDTTSKEVSKR